MSKTRVVIVGGGAAGLTVAAQLLLAEPSLEVSIVEPSDKHYYQPLWTLVGAGIFPREESERNEADYIPRGAKWVRDRASAILPDESRVQLGGGEYLEYDYLVVCPGMELKWNAIKGLSQEIVGKYGICSNYSYQTVETTWSTLQQFQKGTALFTHPFGAIKCGGAPVKICFLAEDYFRKQKIRENCRVIFAVGMPRIFAVDRYACTLENAVARRGIDVRLMHDLIEIRPEAKQAIFRILETDQQVTLDYDMIHVTPKMGPPEFVATSKLAGEGGWVEVNMHTTQHVRFPNVFSLGDCSSLPTSKTGAAIRKQAPVTVANILALKEGRSIEATYNGYTSCPLVTSYNSLVLAEFDYDKQPCESFPFDQSQERFSMMMLKKYALPKLYWHGMLRGRA
ncbi:MAG TPA: FAD/NAD(P)-binding oxidoreductase [Pirellulaceae bacterium]|nr:FAD/NAD(P)-binding oxidoreductase [Pirellulaceae bacterium]HMO92823.1 FAD/NAD(P)-binding oxidoreductase [Pirellulaceae bacterium]HMP69434.1 FAD/NAD(P)-binding oxidoreductase [Pirellulaceae bacterium]